MAIVVTMAITVLEDIEGTMEIMAITVREDTEAKQGPQDQLDLQALLDFKDSQGQLERQELQVRQALQALRDLRDKMQLFLQVLRSRLHQVPLDLRATQFLLAVLLSKLI
jgi:ABC-type phosphate transport system auxiliary subunit